MTSTNDAASLQKDLDNLASWEKKWQMQFHPQKCSVLRITRKKTTQIHEYQLHSHIFKSENSSKYLGVTIDNKLCWNDHIDNICNKANGSLAFLRRNLKISQTHIKANTYTTLVRPQLEYAAAVWDPYTEQNQDKLEMVQRRTARYVFNDYCRLSHVTPMLQQLGWRSLMQRRADIRLVFFYKCLHGLVAIDLSKDLMPQTRETRGNHSQSYICPSDTRNYVKYSFLPRTIVQWNKLPESVVTSPARTPTGRVSAGSPTNFLSISFYFFFAPLTCTHSIFFSSPSLSFLFLLHPYFHSTSTHTLRANKPRREGWLVNRKKKKKKLSV